VNGTRGFCCRGSNVLLMDCKITKGPITADKLKDVIALHQANLNAAMPQTGGAPQLAPSKAKPAELDQDAGGGYNSNRTSPQG
jgi:hypothetical protein